MTSTNGGGARQVGTVWVAWTADPGGVSLKNTCEPNFPPIYSIWLGKPITQKCDQAYALAG